MFSGGIVLSRGAASCGSVIRSGRVESVGSMPVHAAVHFTDRHLVQATPAGEHWVLLSMG